MKKAFVFLVFLFLVSGCSSSSQTYTSESGQKQTVEVSGFDNDEWCQAGSRWSSRGDSGNADMVIVGIVDSGKYKGMCHVKYNVAVQGGSGTVEYYFDQKGNGYQISDINGQHIETEIKAPSE